MKILLASSIYDNQLAGGAGVVVNDLAQALINYGHDVYILTTWNQNFINSAQSGNLTIIRIPSNNLYWIMEKNKKSNWLKVIWQIVDIWNLLTFFQVRQICREIKPDVFHSHKLRGLSPSIWYAARSTGIKRIIHTSHDFELLSPQGLFMGMIGELARRQHFLLRPYQALRRHFSKQVDIFVSPSEYTMSIHNKMGFFPVAKKEIVFNTHGLGASDLEKNKQLFAGSRKTPEKINFLFIGRLEKEKGIDLLCEAISEIDPEGFVLSLSVAGWGDLDEELREKYRDIKSIHFLGSVYGERKKEVFLSHQVLVAPSLVPETFGIIISEAYTYGMPVIASKLGAYTEILQDGKTGILFTSGLKDALKNAIVFFVENHGIVSEMSANCFSEASKYSLDAFIDSYLNLYR